MTRGAFYSKVAGVTAENSDGHSRQRYIRAFCRPGMPLILRREPGNPYDENAIGVWIRARRFLVWMSEVQIGYLNSSVARELARHLDKGGAVTGHITDVTGGTRGKQSLGVNIQLTKT